MVNNESGIQAWIFDIGLCFVVVGGGQYLLELELERIKNLHTYRFVAKHTE